MKLAIVVLATGVLVGTAGISTAGVNCKQVNKYLQTGRSAKDVAETMVIGEDDVKKCQDEAAADAAKGGDAKGAAAGAAEGAGHDQK